MGSSDPEELFCLRWNDYRDSVVSTLSDLRREEDFFDVTLAIDGKQVRAHKLILSACSSFFRKLLRANPAPNPIIVLWDVAFDDIVNLLDFMYNGEVKVRHSNIQTFLALAERFRVRGLCQNEGASGRASPATQTNHSRRRSEDSSPSATRSWHQPKSSPGPSSRRSSSEETPSKRPRVNDSEEILNPEISIKEESRGRDRRVSSKPDLQEGPDDSQLSHSAQGSDAEYDYGAEGTSGGSAPPLPPALMGLGLAQGLDPAAAKEFWRRAAALSLGGPDGFGASLSSPGGASSGSPGGASVAGMDAPRRQRSVFTSQQVAHLEAYFRVSEYIDGDRKRELSLLTNLPEQQIKVWFQNRRQKKKRELEPDYMDPKISGPLHPPFPPSGDR